MSHSYLSIGVFVLSLTLSGVVRAADDPPAPDPLEAYARGDYCSVIDRLEPIRLQGNANIQQRILLGRSYLRLGRLDESLRAFESVLAEDADSADANALVGEVLFLLSQHKRAVEHLKTAYRFKPQPQRAGMLGQCYFRIGQVAEAKRWLETALRQDIRDPAVSLELGKLHLQRQAGALAQKYLLIRQR
jgi:tetratricopeptide (TPR) repeat protein